MISSPLSRFKIVVFPALSSPLGKCEMSAAAGDERSQGVDSQKEEAHLPLPPSVLADNRKQTHVVDVPMRVLAPRSSSGPHTE